MSHGPITMLKGLKKLQALLDRLAPRGEGKINYLNGTAVVALAVALRG